MIRKYLEYVLDPVNASLCPILSIIAQAMEA